MFYIKQNDTSPALKVELKASDGTAINLTGATVHFHMRDIETQVVKVDSAATVTQATQGHVQYNWQTGDTNNAGVFEYEFQVTYSDSTIETFPNNGYSKLKITPEIS